MSVGVAVGPTGVVLDVGVRVAVGGAPIVTLPLLPWSSTEPPPKVASVLRGFTPLNTRFTMPGTFRATKWIVHNVNVPIGNGPNVPAEQFTSPLALSNEFASVTGSVPPIVMLATFSILRLKLT